MELDIIKIDLKIFKSVDSVKTFFKNHNIPDECYSYVDFLYNFIDQCVEYVYFDMISCKILYLEFKDGEIGNIHSYKTKNIENNFKTPTNILTLTKKPKSLSQLSSTDLEKELELCIESEDYTRAIEIRGLLKSEK